jgi:TonB family protein
VQVARFFKAFLTMEAFTLLVERRPDLRATLLLLAALFAVIAATPGQPGIAAPLNDPAFLAQAAQDRGGPASLGGSPSAQANSKKIAVNVFLLSGQPKNPDEFLESRGSRYTYFNSRRLVTQPRPLAEPKPQYPAGKKAERGGAVLLQLLINERGGIDHVDVVCSAPTFEQSALDSMRGMKFRPARDKHGPVTSYMWVEIAYGRGYPCASVPD